MSARWTCAPAALLVAEKMIERRRARRRRRRTATPAGTSAKAARSSPASAALDDLATHVLENARARAAAAVSGQQEHLEGWSTATSERNLGSTIRGWPMKPSRGRHLSRRSSPATRRRSIRWTASPDGRPALGYKGIQIPTWDGRLIDLKKAAVVEDLLRRAQRRRSPSTASRSPSSSTHLQGQLVAVHPAYDDGLRRLRAPEVRGNPKARTKWAVDQVKLGAKACRNLGLKAMVTFTGALRLAVPLSLAAAAGRPDRDRLRRAGEALEADLRRLRRGRRRRRLRAAPGRGPVRRRHLRDVPRAGRQPSALRHQLRPVALRAAAARLPRVHRHLSRADQSLSTSRTPSSTRPAGRASTRGYQPWVEPGRPLPLARRRAGRFRRHLLEARRSTTTTAGRCSNGNAALKHPEDGAREGAEFIRQHIIRVTEKAFDDFAGGTGIDLAGNKKMLGIAEGEGTMVEGRSDAAAARQDPATAWSAAGRAPSSAPCTASRRAWTTSTSWSPARCRPTPKRALARPPALGLAPDRCYGSLRGDGRGGGQARRRHRGGRDRHAEQHARADRRRPSSRPASTSSATSR